MNSSDIETGFDVQGKNLTLFDKTRSDLSFTEQFWDVQDGQVSPPEPYKVNGADELLIKRVMEKSTTDWACARRAAEQIRNPEYTTKDRLKRRVTFRRSDLGAGASKEAKVAKEAEETMGAKGEITPATLL